MVSYINDKVKKDVEEGKCYIASTREEVENNETSSILITTDSDVEFTQVSLVAVRSDTVSQLDVTTNVSVDPVQV